MKNLLNKYLFIGVAAFAMGLTSCSDYLDKEPDSDVDEETAFMNFTNFQGFVEEAYNCIPNKESNYWCCTFNWGEDELMNSGLGDTHATAHIDLGDYRYVINDPQSFLNSNQLNPSSTDKYAHSLQHAWYVIRKMNVGLENLEKLSNASSEEKNLIKGQLLFFRAWWHQALMEFYGGMPYIDEVLPSTGDIDRPRLTFRECAQRCAEDYAEAASLLPNNWDNTSVGKRTLGKNDLRITKIAALAYMGKVLLWAASPLNTLGAQTGASKNGNTYKYDDAMVKAAADAFAEAIANIDKSPYSLAAFKYEAVEDWTDTRGIYDHLADKSEKSNFSDIFRTTGQNWKMPGSTEAILRGPMPDVNGSNWNFAKLWGPKVNNLVEHDAVIHQPTANYVNYAYGMANGLPLNDPESGFDPTHPFKDRDPRFYHDIMFDGFRFLNTTPDAIDKPYQYLEMFTGGTMRPSYDPERAANGSRTGYFCQKLVPHQCNRYDGMYNWGGALQTYLPYLRLADVYLMYAEACAAAGGAAYKSSKCAITGEQAINIVRARAGVEPVAAKYTADKNKFMDEVRRERACELAFEGFRWNDLQRWLLLTEYPYNIKTSQEFYRVGDFDFAKGNPADAEVTGWKEEQILERLFTPKHYLFPLQNSDVYLYADFPQNPGW